MSHVLSPLLPRHQDAQLANERTGALLVSVSEAAFDPATRRRELLGRSNLFEGQALVLAQCNAIHTCWMRFPIDVLFVARDASSRKASSGLTPGASLHRCQRVPQPHCAAALSAVAA